MHRSFIRIILHSELKKDKSGKEIIDTFIPGMIIKLEKLKSDKNKKIFKRLFAPTFSHTINKKGRSCKSCHNNSLALGYGKGEMKFSSVGKWSFKPKFKLLPEDNLPMDAWMDFSKQEINHQQQEKQQDHLIQMSRKKF